MILFIKILSNLKLEKIFLNVTVTKLKSPVSGVHGGVSYSGKETL